MRILKTRWFARYARREKIGDASLIQAIERAQKGLVGAELGGNIIKQRGARPGQGRSGGYRVLIAFRSNERSVFLYGFAKNERENIEPDELATLKDIAAAWMAAGEAEIDRAIAAGVLQEIEP